MSHSLPASAVTSRQPRSDDETELAAQSPTSVSLAELLLISAVSVIGVVSLVALASAHLHHFSLGLVAIVSGVLLAAALAVVARGDRPAVRLDVPGLMAILAGMAIAAVMFFPGFEYGTGDKDPGAYVEHAVAISRTHSIDFPDDLVAAGLPGGDGPGAVWPALWNEPGHPAKIFPQFYHLWPALLATAKSAGGYTGLFNTGPLLGVIAVGIAASLGRRVAGLPGAWTVAVILPTSMLEVWQAKYPSSEIFAQLLFVGALLGVVLAAQCRWRSAAAAAGVLTTLGYLERADGLLVILLAWGALALLLAARRFDARAGWFAVGMLVPFPYALVQAYHLAYHYTVANGVPSAAEVIVVMVAVAGLALALSRRPALGAGVLAWGARPRVRHALGAAFVLICGFLLLIGGLRPRLFGPDYGLLRGVRIHTFDEDSLIRLTWFFSLPGFALMFIGFGFIAWRRWTLERWAIGLATAGLLALYCYHVRNSPFLMWSTRRFVPTVVPGIVLLMGCGAALVVVVGRRYLHAHAVRVVVAAFVAGLMIFQLSESAPLRSHNEAGGSIEIEQQIAALAGDKKGVFLWETGACCSAVYLLFGGPMLATNGQSSALLPSRSVATKASALDKYVQYFKTSGRPVFFVANGKDAPPPVAGVVSQKVLELAGRLPHWAETFTSRPKIDTGYPYDFAVYRVTAAG